MPTGYVPPAADRATASAAARWPRTLATKWSLDTRHRVDVRGSRPRVEHARPRPARWCVDVAGAAAWRPPAPPHATNSSAASDDALPHTQPCRTHRTCSTDRRPRGTVHVQPSNQSHCHGVIVSNGPAKLDAGRGRLGGQRHRGHASGSSSSHATVMRRSSSANDHAPATPRRRAPRRRACAARRRRRRGSSTIDVDAAVRPVRHRLGARSARAARRRGLEHWNGPDSCARRCAVEAVEPRGARARAA